MCCVHDALVHVSKNNLLGTLRPCLWRQSLGSLIGGQPSLFNSFSLLYVRVSQSACKTALYFIQCMQFGSVRWVVYTSSCIHSSCWRSATCLLVHGAMPLAQYELMLNAVGLVWAAVERGVGVLHRLIIAIPVSVYNSLLAAILASSVFNSSSYRPCAHFKCMQAHTLWFHSWRHNQTYALTCASRLVLHLSIH